MTKMLPASFGPVSSVFGDLPSNDKLSTGISIGYPILRIKGKAWSITRGGSEPHVLMRPDGDGPRNSIDVVILAASQYVSKQWYETGYEEGSTASPDCFAPNGIVPDASSPKKQHNTCAGCPQNAWGSAVSTISGKKARACRDSKRVAVAPLGDIRNEAFGGPMMLRIPVMSLADFGNYGDGMEARGYKYWTIGTKMSFDSSEAYPKIVFEPIRPLKDDEATAVLELRASQAVASVLNEASPDTEAVVETTIKLPPTFPQGTSSVESKPEVTSKVTPPPATKVVQSSDGFGGSEPVKATPTTSPAKPKRTQTAAPPPPSPTQALAPEVAAVGSFEDALDDQLEDLLPKD